MGAAAPEGALASALADLSFGGVGTAGAAGGAAATGIAGDEEEPLVEDLGPSAANSVSNALPNPAGEGTPTTAAIPAAASGMEPVPNSVAAFFERLDWEDQQIKYVQDYIDTHNGEAPPGYVGGSIYYNEGPGFLPDKPEGYYHYYDIYPNYPGVDRGPERLITGLGGELYYTPDHYYTFIQIR